MVPQRITAQTLETILVQRNFFPGIKVGHSPVAIATNPNTNRVYVANRDSNTVTVIDGITTTTRNILVGINPSSIAVNPITHLVYVANTLAVGNKPTALAINPVTNKVYVANFRDNT
jgi:YVTN family beta-propeller protein